MGRLVCFVGCGFPAGFRWHCFIVGGDVLGFVSHRCACAADGVIGDRVCMVGELGCLWGGGGDVAGEGGTPFCSALGGLLNGCVFLMTYFSGHMHLKDVRAKFF